MSLSVNRTEYFYSFNKLYTRYIVLIHKVAWNEENVEMKVCDKKKMNGNEFRPTPYVSNLAKV